MDQEVAGQDLAEYEVRRHAEEGDDFLDGVEVLGGQKEGDFALEEYIVAEAIVSDKEEDRLTHFNRGVYSRICGWVTSLTRGNRVGEHKEKSGRCPESRSSTAGGAGRCFLCIWD